MTWPIPKLKLIAYPKPISLRIWMPILAVVAAGSAAAVLLLWPQGRPTQTLEFWLVLIGAPLVACALTFGWKLDSWENHQTHAEESELEQQQIMERWRGWCRRQLHIAGAKALLPVAEGITAFADPGASFLVNKERAVGFAWSKGRSAAVRRNRVLHLIAREFASALRSRREMPVTLMLDDALIEQEQDWATDLQRMFRRVLPDVVFHVETRPAVDGVRWLMRQVDLAHPVPQLVIAAQLWPDDDEERAFSEGAAAFLLDPDAAQAARIFRPSITTRDNLKAAFAQIMHMQILPGRLVQIWSTGSEDESAAINSAIPADSEASVSQCLIDGVTGNPGSASGWIALAIALEAAQGAGPQLVVWREPASEPVYLCTVEPA